MLIFCSFVDNEADSTSVHIIPNGPFGLGFHGFMDGGQAPLYGSGHGHFFFCPC